MYQVVFFSSSLIFTQAFFIVCPPTNHKYYLFAQGINSFINSLLLITAQYFEPYQRIWYIQNKHPLKFKQIQLRHDNN